MRRCNGQPVGPHIHVPQNAGQRQHGAREKKQPEEPCPFFANIQPVGHGQRHVDAEVTFRQDLGLPNYRLFPAIHANQFGPRIAVPVAYSQRRKVGPLVLALAGLG